MRAVISAGSNMEDSRAHLASVVRHFAGSLVAASSLYATAPWGKTDQPDFLNQSMLIDAPLSSAVRSITGEDYHSHLALFHGVNAPFIVSMAVLVAGVLFVIFARHTVFERATRGRGAVGRRAKVADGQPFLAQCLHVAPLVLVATIAQRLEVFVVVHRGRGELPVRDEQVQRRAMATANERREVRCGENQTAGLRDAHSGIKYR